MALKPKMIRLILNKGLSTEVDNKLIVPGELDDLRDGVFRHNGTIGKRWGTEKIPLYKNDTEFKTISGCRGGANRAGDTVLVTDDDELVSYTSRGWSVRGVVVPMEHSSYSVPRGPYSQYDQSQAIAPNGVRVIAWTDGRGGVKYRAFDVTAKTDSIVAAGQEVTVGGSESHSPRVVIVGTNFHVYYVSGSSLYNAVFPYNVPTNTPTINQLTNTISVDAGAYDVIERPNSDIALIAWRNPNATTDISYVRPGGSIAVSGTFPYYPYPTSLTGTEAGPALSMNDDGSQFVVAYGTRQTGAIIRAATFKSSDFTKTYDSPLDRPSTITTVNSGSVLGLSVSVAPGSTGLSPFSMTAMYEVSSSSKISNYVRYSKAYSTSSVPNYSGTFRMHSSMASHIFNCEGEQFVWLNYPSQYQSTDFMYRVDDNKLCAVSRYGQAMPVVSGVLDRPQITDNICYRAAPQRERIDTAGVSSSAILDVSTVILKTELHASGAYAPVDVDGRLFNGGGYLGVYDGTSHVESGFHLLSEPLSFGLLSGSTGLTGQISGVSGSYSYIAIPVWTDAFGDTVRGYPVAGASSVTLDSTHNVVTVTGTMISHTDKDGVRAENIRWELYRTSVNDASIWQRVDWPLQPIMNSTSSNTWVFTDNITDDQLASRQIFYATVGAAQNSGQRPNINPPAPSVIAFVGDRLHVAGCEGDPLTIFSSKLRLGGPISFGLGDEVSVDPGGTISSKITALSPLDNKLIIFKSDRIYAAEGFPQTNIAADLTAFPVPRLITSNVGAVARSDIEQVAGDQFQGIVFKTPNKGIWMLDRGESVREIGRKVRRYDGLHIVATVQDPLTQQVRFFSSEGTTLVYDAREDQWSRFTKQNAVDAFIHDGKVSYVDKHGQVFVEKTGSYTDNGIPVNLYIELGWISFEGLQGMHRVYSIQMLGKRISDHILRVGFARNYDPNFVYSDFPTSATMAGIGYGDGYYGGSPSGAIGSQSSIDLNSIVGDDFDSFIRAKATGSAAYTLTLYSNGTTESYSESTAGVVWTYVPGVSLAANFRVAVAASGVLFENASGSRFEGAAQLPDLGVYPTVFDFTPGRNGIYDLRLIDDQPVYGGDGDDIYQHDANTPWQRVQALKLSFEDVAQTGSYGGFELTEVAIEAGFDKQKAEIPKRKRR